MKFLQQLAPHTPLYDVAQKEKIEESSVIRALDQLKRYTARDIADFAFLHFLVLFLLQNDFDQSVAVKGHARRTINLGNFDKFTFTGTDLYMYLHILSGGARDRLKPNPSNDLFWKRLALNKRELKQALLNLSNGHRQQAGEFRFLQRIEKELMIDNPNYRSCRRLIADWNNQSTHTQELVVTRLLMALRARTPQSDLLVALNDYARRKNLELKDANNPETTNESV